MSTSSCPRTALRSSLQLKQHAASQRGDAIIFEFIAGFETALALRLRPRGKYRQHSQEFKRIVVELAMQPGASVARVACDHGVNANQVFM